MAATVRPLSGSQARCHGTALEHLRAGRHRQALDQARALWHEAPDALDARLLLAMCLAEVGDVQAADQGFRDALALAPGNAVVALNAAAWWRRSGRPALASAVLDGVPESAQVRIQQGLAALDAGDPARARDALERAVTLAPGALGAWHGLANALRALQEYDAAEQAARRVVTLAPRQPAGWFALGALMREVGRVEEALDALRHARALGEEGPALRDAINGVLHDLGRPAEALAGARQLVADEPGFVPAQQTLGQLLWENGETLAPGEPPLAAFEAAARAQPDHRGLQHAYVGALLATRRAEDALAWLAPLRREAPGDPMLAWFEATALGLVGEHARAGALFAALRGALGGRPDFLNAYARHAFRVGEADLAHACASEAVRIDPRDQEGWAHLGVAWRLAGDAREEWLCDYERLVGFVEVPPPAGEDPEHFLAALGRTLEGLHLASREPANQSVRHGSQTGGRLFGRRDLVLQAAQEALRGAVERWLGGLPADPRHPFLSRRRASVRFAGSWSVRLKSSGRHTNHIHNEGWMSSAFYVSLPGAVADGDPSQPHAGWIQFGQPLEEFGLGLPPRRVIQPRAGWLALFPSYLWHGTLPFDDNAPRLTIAFDMQPRP